MVDAAEGAGLTPRARWVVVFVAALLVALGPLGLAVGLEEQDADASARAEAERVGDEIDRLLELRLTETFTLAALPSLRAFAASDATSRSQRATVALNELQAWVAADKPVREAFVVDTGGKVILGTGKGWDENWSRRAFVRRALAGQLDISPPAHDAGEFSQYYASPILDNRQEVAGALIARVAVQELWAPIQAAGSGSRDGRYAVLVDENAVRLVDGGDGARNLSALAPLTTAEAAQIAGEQTYGADSTIARWSQFNRAAEAIRGGQSGTLEAGDLGAAALGVRVLRTKPWTLLVVVPATAGLERLRLVVIPIAAAVLAAGALTVLWQRWR